jgi:hypothetical protein
MRVKSILLDVLKSIPVDQLSFTNNDKVHSQGETREKGKAGPWRGWGKDQEPVSTRVNSVTASERASLGYNNATHIPFSRYVDPPFSSARGEVRADTQVCRHCAVVRDVGVVYGIVNDMLLFSG